MLLQDETSPWMSVVYIFGKRLKLDACFYTKTNCGLSRLSCNCSVNGMNFLRDFILSSLALKRDGDHVGNIDMYGSWCFRRNLLTKRRHQRLLGKQCLSRV
jgi:hypothetical protein